MNTPRKHHYVPQTYLINFCDPLDKQGSIFVYDKINDKKFKANIRDVALERDFYKVECRKEEYYWEHYYSEKVESKYPSIIKTLNATCNLTVNNAVVLTSKLKEELSHLICVQMLRTKKTREHIIEPLRRAGEEWLNQQKKDLPKYLNESQKETLDKFQLTEELFKSIGLEIINDNDRLNKFIRYLLNKNWILYYNNISKDIPFNTSDHPVCYFNVASNSTGFEGNGLNVQTTTIFFPVSSKILIGLYPKEICSGALTEFDGQKIEIDEESFIKKINNIQLEQCYRQFYSSMEYKNIRNC